MDARQRRTKKKAGASWNKKRLLLLLLAYDGDMAANHEGGDYFFSNLYKKGTVCD